MISIQFAEAPDLPFVSTARLLLDIQHLSVMVIGLASPNLSSKHPSLRPPKAWKYQNVINLPDDAFGDNSAEFIYLGKKSPLILQFLLKVPKDMAKGVASAFQFVAERFFFGDLERKSREIDLQMKQRELIKKELELLESAIQLQAKIPDPDLRARFLRNFSNSVAPFFSQYPAIVSVEVKEKVDSPDGGPLTPIS